MPNHVTHRLTITGPSAAITAFFANHFTADDNGSLHLDFNKVIPMPAVLEGTTSGGGVDVGLWLLGRTDVPTEFGGPFSVERYLTYDWVKANGVTNEERLREFLKERNPGYIESAQKAIDAYEATGYISWYPWSIENWGTKWNAYSCNVEQVSDTEIVLVFDTAWSTPEPIFTKLGEMNPELTVDGHCFDEGWGFACEIQGDSGVWVVDGVEANAETYTKVYGEAPESYDDEEELTES